MGTINYQALNTLLAQAGIDESPASAQGVWCGILCTNPQLAVKLPLPVSDPEIKTFYEKTRTQLCQPLAEHDFHLHIVLPEDDEPMSFRLQAFSQWAAGFLAGLGEGGLSDAQAKLPVVDEVLKDFQEFSQLVDAQDPAMSEFDAEEAYMELVEYLKIAVLRVYAELVSEEKIEV